MRSRRLLVSSDLLLPKTIEAWERDALAPVAAAVLASMFGEGRPITHIASGSHGEAMGAEVSPSENRKPTPESLREMLTRFALASRLLSGSATGLLRRGTAPRRAESARTRGSPRGTAAHGVERGHRRGVRRAGRGRARRSAFGEGSENRGAAQRGQQVSSGLQPDPKNAFMPERCGPSPAHEASTTLPARDRPSSASASARSMTEPWQERRRHRRGSPHAA